MCQACCDCGTSIHRKPGARGRVSKRCAPCTLNHNRARSAAHNAKIKRPHFCIECGVEVFHHPDTKRGGAYPKRCDTCRLARGQSIAINAHRPTGQQFTKVCVACGKDFAVANRWHKLCSGKCRHAWYRKGKGPHAKACQHCGASFDTHHKKQKFCSPRCNQIANRRRELRECKNPACGERFEVRRNTAQKGEGKYCSRKCFYDHVHPHRTCQNPLCSKQFRMKHTTKNPWKNKGKYCSPECYRNHRWGQHHNQHPNTKRCKGKRSSQAALATSLRKRCKVFGVTFDPSCTREAVLNRDGWRCQKCRKACVREYIIDSADARFWKNAEHDHIIPLSLGPKVSPGNVFENSQCLCKRCNLKKSNKPEGQLRLSLEEEAWGKGVRVRSQRNSRFCEAIRETAL